MVVQSLDTRRDLVRVPLPTIKALAANFAANQIADRLLCGLLGCAPGRMHTAGALCAWGLHSLAIQVLR